MISRINLNQEFLKKKKKIKTPTLMRGKNYCLHHLLLGVVKDEGKKPSSEEESPHKD